MSINDDYQLELKYLRKLGQEISDGNNDLVPYLSERARDPDVDRLLEGFAYLVARLREKLDAEMPVLARSLLAALCPHYLRPIPSMTVLEFTPVVGSSSSVQTVRAGVEVESGEVEGIPCRYRTGSSFAMMPFEVEKTQARLRHDGAGAVIQLALKLGANTRWEQLGQTKLTLFVDGASGGTPAAMLLRYVLLQDVASIVVSFGAEPYGAARVEHTLQADMLRAQGWVGDTHMIPYLNNTLPGVRAIQQFLAFPERALFLELCGLGGLQGSLEGDWLRCDFRLRDDPRRGLVVHDRCLRLNCVPAINVFASDATTEPVRARKEEYLLTPSGSGHSPFNEIYSVDKVHSSVDGSNVRRHYLELQGLPGHASLRGGSNYSTRVRRARGGGTQTLISLFSEEWGEGPVKETLHVDVTCMNGSLPTSLGIGSINRPTASTPEAVDVRNLVKPSRPLYPPLDASFQWLLVNQVTPIFQPLTDAAAFRRLLGSLDFGAMQADGSRGAARSIESIMAVTTEPDEWMRKGRMLRGMHTRIVVANQGFDGIGDMHAFGTMLSDFLAIHIGANAFHRLTLAPERGSEMTWAAKLGQQALL